MIKVQVQKQLAGFKLDAAFEASGGVTAIFGRSGSGKTTLLNAIAGLTRPDAGHIIIDDRPLFDGNTNLPTHQRRIGYVFQNARLFPHLSVADNLSYGGTHDIARIIDVLGLGDLLGRRPNTLSGGEQQRVALGRALASDPQLLLMDEPLAALDAPRKAEIMPFFERLRDTVKVPIIYVSHAMAEVARLANTLVILQDGAVLRSGPLRDVLVDPAVLPLIGVREAGAVLHGHIAGFDADDGLTRVTFSGGDMVLPGALGDRGDAIRLRVPAQEVILARTRPSDVSALNIWPTRIVQVEQGQGPGVAVVLQAGQDRIIARITRRSAQTMGLEAGQDIFAILKATAVAATDIGHMT